MAMPNLRKCISLICKLNRDKSTSLRPLLLACPELRFINQRQNYFSTSRKRHVHLAPPEVTQILRANENAEEVNLGSVKSFDTNQVPSNSPVEDSHAEARCLLTTGMLFGVFDGHGGPACGQVVAKRLFNYIAASLLPKDVLRKLIKSTTRNNPLELLDSFNDRFDLVEDLQHLYSMSFQKFLQSLSQKNADEFRMRSALENSFVLLDEDISIEAKLQKPSKQQGAPVDPLLIKTLSVALSGTVACVTHIDGEHLHVASCGDCRAVLGVKTMEESWEAEVITKDHNSDNIAEVNRILNEHPPSEQDSVIRNDRLLGQLAPLRAFGDIRFKWTNDELREYVAPLLGDQALTPSSITPPYLTAKPEVFYHKLRSKDHFLIIGSDGLWDLLSPSQAVKLVGEHMSGKTILSPYALPPHPEETMTLSQINASLKQRVEAFKVKPIDVNAATHIIRHALGSTELGLSHSKLSYLLTLPEDTVRLYRDDITAIVVFFDTEFLSSRPL